MSHSTKAQSSQSKIAYIIPGFQHDVRTSEYQAVGQIFTERDFAVRPLSVTWRRTSLSDWITQVKPQITQDSESDQVIFGFSFGAMIATFIAAEMQLQGLVLASLSPYFFENLANIPGSWSKSLGKRRMVDFSQHTFAEIATKINTPTWILVGRAESQQYPLLAKQAEDAHHLIRDSKLIKIPEGLHDVGQTEYLDVIQRVVSQI